MDTQTKRKALSRSKLNSQKRDKFTVFPIVRYNEFRQPVCQVCNVIIVEAISAHLGSPEHLEVASNLKGNATESTQNNNAKPVTDTNSSKVEPEKPLDLACKPAECLEMPKRRTPMVHPPDFLDERGTIRTRSVSKGTKVADRPKGQADWVSSNHPAWKMSEVLNSMDEHLKVLKPRRRKQEKPTAFRINRTSNPPSVPRRSKRIKHVVDKTIKNANDGVSSLEELMKGPATENPQADIREVFSDVDSLVIYKRKRLSRRKASGQTSNSLSLSKHTARPEPSTAAISCSTTASPPHQDPPATTPASVDAPATVAENITAKPTLMEGHGEEVEKVETAEANAQEQVGSNKSQESSDQVDPKADEISTVNTPLNLEAINKMIEEDPICALENILAGKVSISSKTQQSNTPSGLPKVRSSNSNVLSKELGDLMLTYSLGDIVRDYEQISKVLFILDELQKSENFLSLSQLTFIKNFRPFFHNAVSHLKESDTAGIKKVELNQAKEDILLKLQEAKHTQEQITSSISNANNKVNEISSHIEQLEEQLSKLKKERETFQLAIADCGKQKEKLKSDSILWAHQAKDLVFDLAETDSQLKTIGEQLEADKDAYAQFKASFPF